MDSITQNKLGEYLDLLDQLRDRTGNQDSAVALLREIAKDRRTEEIRKERKRSTSEPATDRQKQKLNRLGVKYSGDLTKQIASNLITEAMAELED